MLDDVEGTWTAGDAIDIGIGRFPVKNATESKIVLNKVLDYKKTGLSATKQTTFLQSPNGEVEDKFEQPLFVVDAEKPVFYHYYFISVQ